MEMGAFLMSRPHFSVDRLQNDLLTAFESQRSPEAGEREGYPL